MQTEHQPCQDRTMHLPGLETSQATPALPRHAATDLTHGETLAEIVLADQVYCLRITRAGKLILTK